MGCSFSKENWCFSLTCCFCMRDRPACYWIGGVGLVWGGFATLFDFISANLPNVYCTRCIDYNLNHYLGLTSGGINAIQWVMSCFLIHGARKEIRWMVGVWLAWATVSIVMQLLWFCITLPYTPSVRGFASFFQLVWGIHYFIVIKTHFTRMSLTFTPPEEPLKLVPPNSPTKKHRRHKRRIDQTTQPPIRTLLGAAIKIQGEVLKRQEEGGTIEILAAGEEEDEESEVEVLVVRRTSRGGRGDGGRGERGRGGREGEGEGDGRNGEGGINQVEEFELQPIGARQAEEGGRGKDAREEGDEGNERRKEGKARATRSGRGRRRSASTDEEDAFETDGAKEKRRKKKKEKKRKRREKANDKEEEGNKKENSGKAKESKKQERRKTEERNAGREEMGHEEGDSEEERKERKEKHKQRKEESKKRKKRREDENKGETRDECSGSENPRPLRDERGQGHVAVTIEDPSDTPSGKRESGGAPHRGRGRLRVRLDSLESAARRIRRHSEGAMSSRTRRGSEGNAGSRARRSSEGSVGSRTRRSSEGSVGVRFRRESEESAGVCLEPRGPPSPVSPSHADVMVHWKLEMPQEDDPETSSEASLSSSPPPVRPPQRRPREDPATADGRRRPPSSPTDTGVFGRTPNEEGKREKFRIIEVKRKSQTTPGEPRAKTCSRRTSYKLAVGSPDTQETEIV